MTARFDDDLQLFIDTAEWTFAKTYADTWPHHYIVKEKVDESLFLKMVMHIREHGEWEYFYSAQLKYFEQDGMVYWTMVPRDNDPKWYSSDNETIINRCPVENTYKNRLKNESLPEHG